MKNGMAFVAAGLLIGACSGDSGPPTGTSQTGTIAGQVVDADSANAGVASASIQLTGPGGSRTATTNATGAFTVTGAATGAWQATLQLPPAYRLPASGSLTRNATVVANQTATLTTFSLVRPKGSASGSVSAQGTPLAGGSVAAARPGFTGTSAVPTAAGFTISNLAAGPWTLTYTPPATHALASAESGTRAVTIVESQTAAATAFQVQPAGTPGVIVINLNGTTFVNGTITIPAGTTVRWVNQDGLTHTVTPENTSQAGVWTRQETTSAGTVFEHTFTVPNQTYRYRCEPHSTSFTSGMVGTITVT
jgi:plastocyanin